MDMKQLALWTAVAVAVLALGGPIWAAQGQGEGVVVIMGDGGAGGVQVVQAGENVKTEVRAGGAWGGMSASGWFIQSLEKAITLSDDQKEAMKRIVEARDAESKKFQTENAEKLKAAGAALQEAYKSKDKDAIAKTMKEYQDLYAPFHETMKKSQADLMNVLTADQKAQWGEYQLMGLAKSIATPAELTEDQIKKIKESCAEFLKADNIYSNVYSYYAQIAPKVQAVLTDEQKATIAKARALQAVQGRYWMAKLTEDQMYQVKASYDELAKDKTLQPADIQKKLAEKIDGMLTDEQKEAQKKAPTFTWAVPAGTGGVAAPGAAVSNPKAEEKK
jgi:Spy/CpxP family protein refolding chaperone